MKMFESFKKNMPEGIILPDEFRAVCDYVDKTTLPISGCMKIQPDSFGEVKAWFGNDDLMASNFAYFGAGPDGSILAFWLLYGNDARNAPIVNLCSDGSNNTVLATNFNSFLRLLGIGYDELGFDDLFIPPEHPESAAKFRDWLKQEFGMVCPLTGANIASEAQDNTLSIEAAIDNWYKLFYG
ncbi:hypothetical protein [Shewanella baltica]|uniref:hypothetical protein n=1 Tax=Shewanella baltica TaxID=62322 RepID=UPI003D015C65